jgi:TetR/AcrR family transcriptional repressor of nem operon
LRSPGTDASVADVRAYFDGLVEDLLAPAGRAGCLMVNSTVELAAADTGHACAPRNRQRLRGASRERG